MKTLHVLILFYTLFTINISAQNELPEIEWEKKINIRADKISYDVTQTKDGGYLVAYSTNEKKTYLSKIVKIDASGKKKWEKELELKYVAYIKSVIEAVDKGYVIAGYEKDDDKSVKFDAFVAKLSEKGDIVWKNNYGEDNDDFLEKLIKTSDNAYIFAATTLSKDKKSEVMLCKLSTNGEIKWKKYYSGSPKSKNKVNSIIEANNRDLVFVGTTQKSGNAYTDSWVFRSSPDGQKIWDRKIGSIKTDIAIDLIESRENKLVIIGEGDAELINLDADGQSYSGTNVKGKLSSIVKLANKTLLITNEFREKLQLLNYDISFKLITDSILKKFHHRSSAGISNNDGGFLIYSHLWNDFEDQLRIIKFKGSTNVKILSFVEEEFNKWMQKSSFEKLAAYEARISEQNKKRKKEQLFSEIISKSSSRLWEVAINSSQVEYDAESENFRIDYGSLGCIYINVPIDRAEIFASNFKKIKYFNTRFAYDGRKMFIYSTVLQNPESKHLYKYDSETDYVYKSIRIKKPLTPDGIGFVVNNGGASFDKKGPQIGIQEPQMESERSFKRVAKTVDYITIKGKVIDPNGVTQLIVNGKEAFVSDEGDFFVKIQLNEGENVLKFKTEDILGNQTNQNFTIHKGNYQPVVDAKEDNIEKAGLYYALLIGVSEYTDPSIIDLNGEPVKDAKSLSDVLINQYTFNTENVSILENPEREDVIRKFDELNNKLNSNDNLLIFYAGHGYYDENDEVGYWLPSDAEIDYTSKWIYNNVIVANIKRINSKHTMLISDACFSGSIFKTRKLSKEAGIAYQKKYELKSRNALTSGTLKTVPNKSVFIKYLLDRLSNNKQKYLSASELFLEIEVPISNNSPNLPQFGDIQNVGDEGGDFIFIKRNKLGENN